MLRKFVVLLGCVLISVAAYAAKVPLRKGYPHAYVVLPGDTLWDISRHFLSKPWLWPEIWQANPRVHNPHLIYPGDILKLSLVGGAHLVLKSSERAKHDTATADHKKPAVMHSVTLKPRVRHERHAVPTISLAKVKMFLENVREMSSVKLESTPYVVGFEEGQLRGSVGQNIYVRKLSSRPGQHWAIVRPTRIFRRFGKRGSGHLVSHVLDSDPAWNCICGPWDEDLRHDRHYAHGTELGVEVTVIGHAEVLRGGDPSTLLLLDARREIRAGDRVLPLKGEPYDPHFYPHSPRKLPVHGRVIALLDAMSAVGPHQVVVLSVGRKDNVDNGTTFAVWQPGARIADDVVHGSLHRGISKKLALPNEYIGHVMVFRRFNQLSYALVMNSLRPIKMGDRLRLPK